MRVGDRRKRGTVLGERHAEQLTKCNADHCVVRDNQNAAFANESACPGLPVPAAQARGSFGVPIIRGIEKTLDLIDSLAGVIVTNLNESTRVL